MSHRMMRSALVCVLMLTAPIVAACGVEPAVVTAASTTPGAAFDYPVAPITTPMQWDAWVRATPLARSPLGRFTPAGRQRFVDGLVFGSRDLGGMNTEELSYELTRAQAFAVLRLFGEQRRAAGLDALQIPRAPGDDTRSALDTGYDLLLGADDAGHAPARTDAERASAVATIYRHAFAPTRLPAQLRALNLRSVQLTFRAAHLLWFTTQQTAYLDDMQRAFDELQRRSRVDRSYATALYDALLVAHRTARAQALRASQPSIQRELPPVLHTPDGLNPHQPSRWVASPGKRELTRQPLRLDDTQVLVLASTGCHYSQNAARDIDADPALRKRFREHAQWIAPTDELVAFDAVQQWNHAHPALPLAIANDNRDLPMVSRLDTPTFYFLRNGKVVDTVVGWPGDSQREMLRAAFARLDGGQ